MKVRVALVGILGLASCLSQAIADGVDLRPTIASYGLVIRSQGSRGTCSVFALTFLQEYMTARKTGRKNFAFSEEYLNCAKNLACGSSHDGGFFADLDRGYQAHGDVDESDLPYQNRFDPSSSEKITDLLAKGEKAERFQADFIKHWNNRHGPSDTQIDEVLAYLDKGIPVAAGLLWPNSGADQYAAVDGIKMMIEIPRSSVFDGHSIDLVGYKKGAYPGGGYFIIRNSFGPNWGDHGYGYIAFDYIKAYANDLVAYH